MFCYFTYKNILHYFKVLPQLMSAYNHRKHRSLGMAPADVTRKNEKVLWETQYGSYLRQHRKRYRYQVNDTVRITKLKTVFQWGYEKDW